MGKANTGFISKLPNGTYKAYLELPPVNGKRKRKVRRCKTLSEAKRALVDLNLQKGHLKDIKGNPSKLLFKEAVEVFNQTIQRRLAIGDLKTNTVQSYQNWLKVLLLPRFSYTPILSIDFQAFFEELAVTKRYTIPSISRVASLVRGILKANNLDPSVASFKSKKATYTGAAISPLDTEELEALNEYFKTKRLRRNEPPLKYLYYFALITGCRKSEILGLRWRDVHQEDNCIDIRNTIVQVIHEGLKDDTPKSLAGNRRLVVPESLFKVLEELKSFYKFCGIPEGTKDDYVFHTKELKPIHPSIVGAHWRTICLKCCKRPHRFHDIRHTNITMKIINGIDIKTISLMAGHSRVDVTLNIYGHYWQEAAQKAANIFDIYK